MFAAEAVVTSAGFILSALLLGTLLTAAFLLPAGEPASVRKALTRAVRNLLVLFIAAGLFVLWVQGMKLQGGNFPPAEIMLRYIARTQSGKVWLAREAYAGFLLLWTLAVMLGRGERRAVQALFVLSLPLVASRSLISHAIAVQEQTALVVTSDAVHLVVTALWAGALPVIFWVLVQCPRLASQPLPWVAVVVGRFSRVALASVAVLVLTGFYQSWIHVQSFSALLSTIYGRVLTLKLCLFFAMAVLGAWNFLCTRPELMSATALEPVRTKALRRIGAESLLGLLVLCVTGALTILPPAAHSAHQRAGQAASAPVQEAQGARKFAPADGASVMILSPKNGQLFKGDQIPVTFRLTKGKRGQHVHAYIDGELVGMFQGAEGILTGIQAGKHVLEARVVAEDHQTELDAADRVEIVVE